MMDWILYLLCNLFLSAMIAFKGKAVLDNLKSGQKDGWVFTHKDLPKHNEKIWTYAQKTYGSAAFKGGLALIISDVVVMLCVMALDDVTMAAAAGILFVLETLFFMALGPWTMSKVRSRFPKDFPSGKSEAPAPAKKPYKPHHAASSSPKAEATAEHKKEEEKKEPDEQELALRKAQHEALSNGFSSSLVADDGNQVSFTISKENTTSKENTAAPDQQRS
ncbi:hypothetical protein [Allobaculum mucilyticum]|uniref:hypothetical protein n=1 Tax=Allobaculum mucilyticum TaxID=2834459 RepID=UPI001E2E146D|nr:hypothetical protein [Allobaculum mucilyticum]UNT95196.1 hypothetical protein KWG62_07480 [Allobaculum mucilyticum]